MSNKVILIGDGAVGSTFAYTVIHESNVNELGVIDINMDRVAGDVLDLEDATPYTFPTHVFPATYDDCADADVVVIAAGIPQKPGETRLDLVDKNLPIFKDMVTKVVASGFKGIFLIMSNPVDVLTYATYKFSGFPKERVLGSGTSLDTARLRVALGKKFEVAPEDVSAYILGEHGDSEVAAYKAATIAGAPVLDLAEEKGVTEEELHDIYVSVRDKAYKIIDGKGATYYGVGTSTTKILNAILNDKSAVVPASAYLGGKYGHDDVYTGVPAKIGQEGLEYIYELPLSEAEQTQFDTSVSALKKVIKDAFAKLED